MPNLTGQIRAAARLIVNTADELAEQLDASATYAEALTQTCSKCAARLRPQRIYRDNLGPRFAYICDCGATQEHQLVSLGHRLNLDHPQLNEQETP